MKKRSKAIERHYLERRSRERYGRDWSEAFLAEDGFQRRRCFRTEGACLKSRLTWPKGVPFDAILVFLHLDLPTQATGVDSIDPSSIRYDHLRVAAMVLDSISIGHARTPVMPKQDVWPTLLRPNGGCLHGAIAHEIRCRGTLKKKRSCSGGK